LGQTGLVDVAVLNWGQNEYQLRLRRPLLAISQTHRFLCDYRADTENQFYKELRIPHLTWASQFLRGNINGLAARLTNMEKPDLIHAHVSFPGGFVARQLASLFHIPYIITEHSGPFPFREFRAKKGLSPLISVPLWEATRVIAVSTYLKNEMEKWIPREVQVIPNLVNTDTYIPQANTYPNKDFVFFALTGLRVGKGVLDLIKAVQILLRDRQDFKLLIGGGGPLHKKLVGYIRHFSLTKHIILLGELMPEDTLRFYHCCDCYVLPSHLETFGVVLIEALSCGKPIIATDCGGPEDIVTQLCGQLVKPHNPAQLALAMKNMIAERSQYDTHLIRDYCIERFGHESVTRQLIDMYRKSLVHKQHHR